MLKSKEAHIFSAFRSHREVLFQNLGLRKLSIVLFLAGFIGLLILPFCTPGTSSDSREAYLNHHDSAEYVGMEVCANCHLDKQQTFIHTGMGMSFDSATRKKSAGGFTGHQNIYDPVLNFFYRPFWRNDSLILEEYRLSGMDTTYKRQIAIDYIIGSGQHTNSHLVKKGDYIVQAPFTYYTQKGVLDLPPGFENGNNSRLTRIIDSECMSCHNSMPQMKSNRRFISVGKGIDCERCHGPGSLHVAFRSQGKTPKGAVDYTIVNPSKLSWERQIDVCQRCHLQGNNVLKKGKTFLDFKPGMKLSDFFEIYLPEYEGESRFNMANHADRFQSSQCFIATNKIGQGQVSFTCISCHNPHVSVKAMPANHFNQVCGNCHGGEKGQDCKELESKRLVLDNNCIKCHMPISGTEDIPHVTVHDHKIGVYTDTIRTKPAHSRLIGLYAVNNPNPEIETQIRAYLSYYEKFDPNPLYQRKADELLAKYPDAELQIHLNYQRQNWKKVIEESVKLSDDVEAITQYRVGKAYYYSQSYQKASEWLQLAALKDQDRFEYKSEWSAALIKMGKYEEAHNTLNKALNLYPDYLPALNNIGFCSLMLNRFSEAEKWLTLSLELDPDNIQGLENLALLYDRLNKKEALKATLLKILKINPKHKQASERLLTIDTNG